MARRSSGDGMFSNCGLAGLGLVILGLYWKGPAGVIYIFIGMVILTVGLKILIEVLKLVLFFAKLWDNAWQHHLEKRLEREARQREEDAHMIGLAAVMEATQVAVQPRTIDIGELRDRGDGVYEARRRR